MGKPVSRPNELGRAIGYHVDVALVLEKLKNLLPDHLERLKENPDFLAQVEHAAAKPGSAGRERPKRLWVVVKAENGVPVMIDAYPDKRSATRRAGFLRQHMRPGLDEVAQFPVTL